MSRPRFPLTLVLGGLTLFLYPGCDSGNDGWSGPGEAGPEGPAASVTAALEAKVAPAPETKCPDLATGDHQVKLEVDANTWKEGELMAQSLSKMLTSADYTLQETPHGLDADAGALFGGFLTQDAPLFVTRSLGGGREYVFFAGGAGESAIHLRVYDAEGQLVAQDKIKGSEPRVVFRPAKSGQFRLELSLGGGDPDTFATMGVAVEGGYRVSKARMQGVFQHLLDRAGEARVAAKKDGRGEVSFLKGGGDWSINTTILLPNESIRQRGIEIAAGSRAMFLAVCHDKNFDIDSEVEIENESEEGTGTKWTDSERDGEPVLDIDPVDHQRKVILASEAGAGAPAGK
jgi:hypothetical protein